MFSYKIHSYKKSVLCAVVLNLLWRAIIKVTVFVVALQPIPSLPSHQKKYNKTKQLLIRFTTLGFPHC